MASHAPAGSAQERAFQIWPNEVDVIMKMRLEGKQSGKKRKADVAPAFSPDEDVLSEYRCPITQELPVDPVIAQDGHAYERTAIEDWLERAKDGEAKSPMTNEFMGKTVVPAVQTRNAIERLIAKGVISGEVAQTWTAKQAELQAIDKDKRLVLAQAHKGNVVSMRTIGFCYRDATCGFALDVEKAREWFSKAAVHDDAHAVVSLGIFHLNGTAVPKDAVRGMIELTRAAMLGSEHGAITIAHELVGDRVKTRDDAAATRWYQFSRKCKFKDSVESSRSRRDEWLKARGLLEDP
jgi:hypothetical protein